MDLILFNFKFYLFLAVLGFCCCVGCSLVVASRGSPLVVTCGLLSGCDVQASIAVASLVWSKGSRVCGLNGCSSWALGLRLNSCGVQA